MHDRIADSRFDYFLNVTVPSVPLRLYEMASPENQIIPLEDIPRTNAHEGFPELQSSTRNLVDAEFRSISRRKVVIIAGVIAVLIVVIVAGSLIGIYVSDHLSDKCKW